jgi:hypothetical protein
MNETTKTSKYDRVTVDAGELKILEAAREKSRRSFQNGAKTLADNVMAAVKHKLHSNGFPIRNLSGQTIEAIIVHELGMLGLESNKESK